MVGDVQIGTVTADGFSQELYDRGKGTGFHQFVTVPTLSGEFPGDWVGFRADPFAGLRHA